MNPRKSLFLGSAACLLGLGLLSAPSAQGSTAPVDGPQLTWAPPALTAPVTYHLSGDGPGTIKAPPGQDSIVVWDSPTHRRVRFNGGRHWVIRGGEVINDKQWPNPDDQSGVEFEYATGTVFIEGLYIHGSQGRDGIRIGKGGSAMTVIVQNTRITERFSGPGGYHADVMQAFGGVRELKVDRLTGSSDYQGQMWKQEPGTVFGPSDFRRVNYVAATPEVNPMINLVMTSPTRPVTLTDVYNQPDPRYVNGNFCRANFPSSLVTCALDATTGRKYVTWPITSPIQVTGRVTQGLPPGGDYVPDGAAGLTYQSPGYLS